MKKGYQQLIEERKAADKAVIEAAFDMLYNSRFINDTEKINAIIDALRSHPDYDEKKEGDEDGRD